MAVVGAPVRADGRMLTMERESAKNGEGFLPILPSSKLACHSFRDAEIKLETPDSQRTLFLTAITVTKVSALSRFTKSQFLLAMQSRLDDTCIGSDQEKVSITNYSFCLKIKYVTAQHSY